MKFISIVIALSSLLVNASGSPFYGFLENHVMYDSTNYLCKVVAKVKEEQRFRVKSLKECQQKLPQLINAEYSYIGKKSMGCTIISYPFKVSEFVASNEHECYQMAAEYFQRKDVHPPFLDYSSWHEQTKDEYAAVVAETEDAMDRCRIETAGGMDVFYRYDKRVKELKSLKEKIFTRVSNSQKSGFDFKWDWNMNDGIGFRIVFNTVAAPGGVKAFMECLQDRLGTTAPRTIDGMTFYASNSYNVPSLNQFKGKAQGNSVLEYQTWSLASGLWMIWQHDIYYKFPKDQVTSERKTYVKSSQMASLCLDDPKFVRNVLPKMTSEEQLDEWLHENCDNVLREKHEAGEKKKLEKNPAYNMKPYEPKAKLFSLRNPPSDIEPLDLVHIVWTEAVKYGLVQV